MIHPQYPIGPRTIVRGIQRLNHVACLPLRRLGVTGLILVAAATLMETPVAQAGPVPPALLQTIQAMATVHSYKMTMDTTTGGPYPSSSHIVAVFLRAGKMLSFDIREQSHPSIGKATNIEMVLEGSRLCMKGITGPAWSCSTNTTLAASFASIGDLSKVATNLGTKYSMKALSEKSVQGQECSGYLVTSASSGTTDKGVVWINAASHLLVEEDMVTATAIPQGAKPTTGTFKVVVSNYNDPSLSLPKV